MTFFESPAIGAPHTGTRGRGPRWRAVLGILLAVLAAFLGASTLPGILDPVERTVPDSASTAFRPAPALDPELAALADRMALTAKARETFAWARPRFVTADEVAQMCGSTTGDEDGYPAGCFIRHGGSHDEDRIVIYRPSDERLADSLVTVAAHELLHAVYARLQPHARTRVAALVAAETARVPADDPVHEQIAASMRGEEDARATEQFAYLGSQVRPEGGFAAELEAIYARTFTDRAALVDAHRRAAAVIDGILAAVAQAEQQVADAEHANARGRAQLEADERGYQAALVEYEQDAAEFESTPPAERERWIVTLTPPGGSPMTMSWAESLEYRRADLERIRVELQQRRTGLDAAESRAARQRADAEALRADALTLLRDAHPGKRIDG